MSEPRYFAFPAEWRDWLEAHHASSDELWVGFHKKATGKPSLTWPESVDEALCFGWIDGLRKSLGEDAYKIRFTPRRPASIWSAVNLRRVEELTKLGRMSPAGLAAHARRTPERSEIYSHERQSAHLSEEQERELRAHPQAHEFFQGQPASYRKAAAWWMISAKKEETQKSRLATLIADSAAGRLIKQFARPTPRAGDALGKLDQDAVGPSQESLKYDP